MSRSVLVVDDDACFRELVVRILDGSGYEVVGEAGSVEEAIASAVDLRPDTALVDVGLPDGDGFSLAEQLHAMPWALDVVVVSIDGEGNSDVAARRAGACGFLRKDELSAAAVQRLIEGGRPG